MSAVGQGLASLVEHAEVGVLHVVRVTHRIQLVLVTAGRPAHTLKLSAWKLGRVRQTHSSPGHAPVEQSSPRKREHSANKPVNKFRTKTCQQTNDK